MTWEEYYTYELLFYLAAIIGMGLCVVLIAIATKWEKWKKKQPNWDNNWED